MPLIVDPFMASGFDMATLSRAISVMPILYGRLAQPFTLGGQSYYLFPFEPISTREVRIDLVEGKLVLLDFRPVGSPGSVGDPEDLKTKSFSIPFIPHDDVVLPTEVQGVRALGTNDVETLQNLVLRKLRAMRNKHDITHEFLRSGALSGKIMTPRGAVYIDLYADFGIEEKVVVFDLNNAATEVLVKCQEVSRHVEDNLGGDVMAGVYSLVGKTFFDKLIVHPKVKDEYQRWRQGEFPGKDYRRRFEYGGIVFEEYRGRAKDNAGQTRVFIAEDEARFFPVGTADTFRQYAAPGDFNETVNTLGEIVYAKIRPVEMERGYKLHTQSSPLPLCLRPQTLVKGKVAA